MYQFATALIAGTFATVLVSGIAFMPPPAEAARLSKAERVTLEKATAACKVEAKGVKFRWHWLKRQKYVRNCIIRTAVQADPQHKHLGNPEGGEYDGSSDAATRGMGM